jgi:hypothetical protein
MRVRLRKGFHDWKIRQMACFCDGKMKGLIIRHGAGIRSRSGSASVEQKRRMSAIAAKKRIPEAVSADALERIDAYSRTRRTIVKPKFQNFLE